MDTGSLMHSGAPRFFRSVLAPLLLKHERKLILAEAVLKELRRLAGDGRDLERRASAKQGLCLVEEYERQDLLDRRGEPGDDFPDQLFLALFTKHRLHHDICLITQDEALAHEAMALGYSNAVLRTRDIATLRIDRDGSASPRRDGQSTPVGSRNGSGSNAGPYGSSIFGSKPGPPLAGQGDKLDSSGTPPPHTPLYSLFTGTPSAASTSPLRVSRCPGAGDLITSDLTGQVRLGERLAGGGQGDIYLVDNGMVCKVYKPEKLVESTRQKLELMLRKPVSIPGVCWPRSLAFNQRGELVGYLMDRAQGKTLARTVFAPKPFFLAQFPSWTNGARVISAPENGEFANQTWFLDSHDAIGHLRLQRGTLGTLQGFALLSDGSGEQLVERRTGRLADALGHMAGWLREESQLEVTEAIATTLSRVLRERTGDDCSLCLASRVAVGLSELEHMDPTRRREILGATQERQAKNRLRILKHLARRPSSASAVGKALGMGRRRARNHLRQMSELGIAIA